MDTVSLINVHHPFTAFINIILTSFNWLLANKLYEKILNILFELQINTTKKGLINTLVKRIFGYNDSCLSRANKQNNRTYKIVYDEGFFSLIYYYFHNHYDKETST